MCGILAYWGRDRVARERLDEHLGRIRHRGPDHADTLERDGLYLGHNRLAIIDLESRSNQPMVSACGRIALIFNGEIYNYLELKQELTGFPFRTNSDTEVIIAAYLKWGAASVARFNGMFSFAMHDREAGTVLLARDPIGKKPLYYTWSPAVFACASELKALIGLPHVDDALDASAINEYFAAGFIGGERTIYRAIAQLPAGHIATVSLASPVAPVVARYWQLPAVDVPPVADETPLVDELDELLRDAVAIRLRSDVSLGVFLSGGLDSSLVTAIAASQAPELRTFTISFAGTATDEAAHAAAVARHFSTRHTVYDVNEDVLDVFPSLVASLDQPFADSSMIPMYFVCREARREVTVALSGDGGDELFAGYGHYDAFAWEERMRRAWPGGVRRLAGRTARFLPDRHRTRMVKRLAHDDIYVSMAAHGSRFFDAVARRRLLRDVAAATDVPEARFLRQFVSGLDWQQNICRVDFQQYMVDDILVKVDRMSMLNSLEVRSPLLDRRVADFSFSKVPSDLKRRGHTRKYLLAQVARKYLPAGFLYNRKHGFGVPLGDWFRGELGDRLADRLSGVTSGYIDSGEVRRLLERHRRGLSNVSKQLYAVLVWEEWYARQRRAVTASTT